MSEQNKAASRDVTAVESTPTEKPPRPPRSRTERMIVWGVITALLVVVAAEALAQFRFQKAFNSLSEQLVVAEETQSEQHVVTQEDVDLAVDGRRPDTTEQLPRVRGHGDRVDGYRWKGVLKDRQMYVYYGVGEEPPVLFITTELLKPLKMPGVHVLGSEDLEPHSDRSIAP